MIRHISIQILIYDYSNIPRSDIPQDSQPVCADILTMEKKNVFEQ